MFRLDKRWILGSSQVLLLLAVLVLPVRAATTVQSVVQSYTTDKTVRQGMIVGLKAGHNSAVVEPLTADQLTKMLGVAISASDATITLTGGSTPSPVYVATSGQYNVLVSNQNGPVHIGDYISISTLDGIGMKATPDEGTVLGKAAADFSGSTGVVSTATVKTGGSNQKVAIGSIPVTIGIGINPVATHGLGNLPGFLQVASSSIANKPVSALRTYISLGVLIITTFITGSILYSGVRSSIISIGRNPLAKRSILGGLLQVVLTSIIIFIVGLFAVYLLLRI